jgi:hypothetical protein
MHHQAHSQQRRHRLLQSTVMARPALELPSQLPLPSMIRTEEILLSRYVVHCATYYAYRDRCLVGSFE